MLPSATVHRATKCHRPQPKERLDPNGQCTVQQSGQVCNFTLPRDVKARDPNITHFHLTQLSVLYSPPPENLFYGPCFPWEVETTAKDERTRYYVQIFQVSPNLDFERVDAEQSDKG